MSNARSVSNFNIELIKHGCSSVVLYIKGVRGGKDILKIEMDGSEEAYLS